MQNKQATYLACLYLTVAAALWGGNYIVGKMAVATIPPVTLSWLRWAPAAIIVLLVCLPAVRRQWAVICAGWWKIVLLSVLGVIIFPTTLYQGLQTTASLNAALYLAAVPALVLVLNALFFKDKVSAKVGFAVLLSFVGVLVLLSKGSWMTLRYLTVNSGDFWAIISALSWACYCSLLRIKPVGLTVGVFLAVSLLMGVVLLTLLWWWELSVRQLHWSAVRSLVVDNWLAITYLIVGPSILSYWLWNKGMSIVGTAKGSVFNHVIPFSSAVFAVLFLKEPIYAYHLLGFSAIVSGIVMVTYAKHRRSS